MYIVCPYLDIHTISYFKTFVMYNILDLIDISHFLCPNRKTMPKPLIGGLSVNFVCTNRQINALSVNCMCKLTN